MITLDDMKAAREYTDRKHRAWKQRSLTNDLVASGEWETLWDDASAEITVPLVENIYLEALEDKAMTAGTLPVSIIANPTPGTRADKAERNAEKKRRVHLHYMERSEFDELHVGWYYDWFHHGAAYAIPWYDPYDRDGNRLGPDKVFPYYMTMDPRQAFPISHDSRKRLTSIMFRRIRPMEAIIQEYGQNHPAVQAILYNRAQRMGRASNMSAVLERAVEEIWFFDEMQWGVAFADQESTYSQLGRRNEFRVPQGTTGGMFMEWAFPPERHMLDACPVAEAKRATFDGEYRSPLDSVVPNLRVAHNLMARILDDAADQVYAPVVADNIENIEDYGPGAILRGDGNGPARIDFARPPSNFEATQKVQEKKAEARAQARHPEQRQGDAGASIVSDKGLRTLMGSFNSELASAQLDMQRMLKRVHGLTANLDAVYGAAEKGIVVEDRGTTQIERYNPALLFKGDYRIRVTYGGNLGLDQNARILNAATIKNMQGMSTRTFMEHTGMIPNPLAEEREIGLENFTSVALQLFLMQAQSSGDMSLLQQYADLIDGDDETHRSAVLKVMKERPSQQAPTQPGAPTPPGQGDPGAAVLAANSAAQGGVTGSAEGQPLQTDALRSALGPGAVRALSASGGNGP